MGIGKSVIRQDAIEKAMGAAKYTEDILPRGALMAATLHGAIANGKVKAIDVSRANQLPGVVYVATCFDVPDRLYTTPGHPYSLDPAHRDIADKRMLTRDVRYYGDDVAVVVAEDGLTARKALSLITVEYEEGPPLLNAEAARASGPLHPECFDTNVFAGLDYAVKDGRIAGIGFPGIKRYAEEIQSVATPTDLALGVTYRVPQVHACHIENITCFAYMEGKRIMVVTATQVPHIMRRIVSEAISYPLGDIRVIKPYVGGAFGNKQDVYYEPLAAWLTQKLGGRCVAFLLSREETFVNSRTRHGMQMDLSAVYGDNRFKLRRANLICDQGAHAAHGHAVAANAIINFDYLYESDRCIGESCSVYMNKPSGGALRGYGIPQINFAMEAFMDELAAKLGRDPLELRRAHMTKPGFVDPFNGIAALSNGLEACVVRGMELTDYENTRARYGQANAASKNIRRGIGMAIYIYTTSLGRIALETSSARIVLNQNGSVQLQVGATELGQGSDTAFAQMASEVLKIPEDKIHVVSNQDTDVCPYDPGAFASRQTFVAGSAVKQTAEQLKTRVLEVAARLAGLPADTMDLSETGVVAKGDGKALYTLEEIALHSLYDIKNSRHLTAESTCCMKENAFSFGACFADVSVDVPVGKATVNKLAIVLDSGRIINPALAKAQVHGGVSMGLGYALMEQMLFDPKTGKMRNDNLLDYKIPTAMDMPEIVVDFVETEEPEAPFGNKSLGEPPVIPTAPAIRNAILHATGVAMRELPMTPQRLVEAFTKAGLVEEG